jgi:hypothetical protein
MEALAARGREGAEEAAEALARLAPAALSLRHGEPPVELRPAERERPAGRVGDRWAGRYRPGPGRDGSVAAPRLWQRARCVAEAGAHGAAERGLQRVLDGMRVAPVGGESPRPGAAADFGAGEFGEFAQREEQRPAAGTRSVYVGAFAAPTHCVARCAPSVGSAHQDAAALSVLAQLVSANFLHREVREKGGAYGAGMGAGNGWLSLSSYYDPDCVSTLGAFDGAVEWACRGAYDDREVEEAKLAIFSDLSSPVTPASVGGSVFALGVSDALRQAKRDQYFNVSREDLSRVAHRYMPRLLGEQAGVGASSTVIFGSTSDESLRGRDGWDWIRVDGRGDGAPQRPEDARV